MDTTTFSVAATASELATKVRAWLRGQTTTSPDVAPASYQLETTAATSEKYAVVLVAVYTVGPKRIDDKIPAGSEEPLLRRAKLLAPPEQVSPAGGSCPRHVRSLLKRHVSALAAGMSMEEMLAKGASGFVDEALRRVNLDLLRRGNSGGVGLLVYGARVERLGIQVPCDTVSLAVLAQNQEGGAAPTTAYTLRHVVKLEVILSGVLGGLSVSVDREEAAGEPPAEQVKVAAAGVVEAEFHMQLRGKTTLRLKLTGNLSIN